MDDLGEVGDMGEVSWFKGRIWASVEDGISGRGEIRGDGGGLSISRKEEGDRTSDIAGSIIGLGLLVGDSFLGSRTLIASGDHTVVPGQPSRAAIGASSGIGRLDWASG